MVKHREAHVSGIGSGGFISVKFDTDACDSVEFDTGFVTGPIVLDHRKLDRFIEWLCAARRDMKERDDSVEFI
jgi:hypothetical protein